MKKYILGGIAAVAIAAVAVTNVKLGAKNDDLSVITLDNVEATAACEISRGGEVKLSCSGANNCSTTYLGYTLTCDGTKN
jgi:hypothetical protein